MTSNVHLTDGLEQSNPIVNAFAKELANKKILILGFGREGQSSYRFLRRLVPNGMLTIMDQSPESVRQALADMGPIEGDDSLVDIVEESLYLQELETYDGIFKTPGIPGFLLSHISSDKIWSQSDWFLRFLGDRTIAVTGTKGKSTTSSMIAHVMKQMDRKVELVGNIGRPAFECLFDDDGKTYYVYEMSSFQTEFLKHRPIVGVVLNLFEEHLNNYVNYEAYQEAKLQLFKGRYAFDTPSLSIYGCDNALLKARVKDWTQDNQDRAKQTHSLHAFGNQKNNVLGHDGVFVADDQVIISEGKSSTLIGPTNFERHVLGSHNLLNSLVVIDAVTTFNAYHHHPVEPAQVIGHIGTFHGLRHRLQYIGTFHGCSYYNDSISTTPESCIQGAESIKNLEVLIVGGYNRGIHYESLMDYLIDREELTVLFLPETGHLIHEQLVKRHGDRTSWLQVSTVEEAVREAVHRVTESGAVLLSPAASSYNQYKNFEERGEDFIHWVTTYA